MEINHYTLIIIRVVLGSIFLFLNFPVLLTIICSSRLRKLSFHSYIASLTSAFILAGLSTAIAGIIDLFSSETSSCVVLSTCLTVSYFASMLTLVALSVDRWLSLHRTVQAWHARRSRRLIITVICITWVISIIIGLIGVGYRGHADDMVQCYPSLRYTKGYKIVVASI